MIKGWGFANSLLRTVFHYESEWFVDLWLLRVINTSALLLFLVILLEHKQVLGLFYGETLWPQLSVPLRSKTSEILPTHLSPPWLPRKRSWFSLMGALPGNQLQNEGLSFYSVPRWSPVDYYCKIVRILCCQNLSIQGKQVWLIGKQPHEKETFTTAYLHARKDKPYGSDFPSRDCSSGKVKPATCSK